MEDKKIYMIGIALILLYVFNTNSTPLQASFKDFDTGNITGWFKSLGKTTQNMILVILGLLTFLIVIGLLMRN